MELLFDPQVWLSFLMLAALEMVLGIDNVIFLTLLVDRLPEAQHREARILGLSFAMLTRIALLMSITWLAALRRPLFMVSGITISVRNVILLAGGALLIVKGLLEIRDTLRNSAALRKPGPANGFWLIIAQIGLVDIVFSLDSVFTAVGLANRIEVMVAAIVASVLVMMMVSSVIGAFVGRYPTVKMLALSFLVLVGVSLIGESLELEIPKGYLYSAMIFSGCVEWLNIRLRRRGAPKA